MPRKEQGWITFQTSLSERQMLEEFCNQSQRTKTEILRELVRGLIQQSSPSTSLPTKSQDWSDADVSQSEIKINHRQKPTKEIELADKVHIHQPEIEISGQKKSLKVSSRNILKGVVKRIVIGPVNSEVTLEIVQKVELTSIITSISAEELELHEGQEVYAVIKSSDVVIARE
jgi:molybdopterin-binding protein